MKYFKLRMNGKDIAVSSANLRSGQEFFAIFPNHGSLVGKGNLLYYHIDSRKIICDHPCIFAFENNQLNIHNLIK